MLKYEMKRSGNVKQDQNTQKVKKLEECWFKLDNIVHVLCYLIKIGVLVTLLCVLI